MSDRDPRTPGPLRDEKRGPTSEPGHPQPQAAEVESARTLANETKDELRSAGLSEDRVRQLADQFIAEDRGEDPATFIEWARRAGPAP